MANIPTRSFIEHLEHFERVIVKWGILTLAFVVALAVFVFEVVHILPLPKWGEKTLHTVAILIALGVVRLIFGIARDSGKLLEKEVLIAGRVEELGRDLDKKIIRLADDLSPKLDSLGECVISLKKEAEEIYPIENLKMDWLGLDMANAWRHVKKSVLINARIKRAHLRMLMISPEWSDEPPWLPPEVHQWKVSSAKMFEQINTWLAEELPQIRASGREIHIEIKRYDRLPIVHGFRIKEPIRTSYVSFCRWEGINYRSYDWGETKYRKISGEFATPASRDLVDVFIGQFEHLWRTLPSTEIPALSGAIGRKD